MRGRRNQHEWSYMGVSNGGKDGMWKGELSYCDLCKKYRVSVEGKGFTFISKKRYLELKIIGSESW